MRVACRVQHAAAGIGHVGHDANHLEAIHELDGLFTTALDAEREDAAREAALELLLGEFIVLVAFEAGVVNPGDLRVVLEELGAGESVFTVTRHAEVQSFETDVQEECVLRRLDRTEVAHELCGCLRDVSALAESLRIGEAVVARIRFGEALETIVVSFPIKVAAIHNATTDCHGVAVHVLGRGVGHDVNAEFDRTAENRGRVSTIIGTPCLWARSAKRLRSKTLPAGFATVSPKTHLVFGRKAFSISSSEASWSTNVHSMPSFFIVTEKRLLVPP